MTGIEPVLAIAGSQRGWASELVRFLSDFGGARLRGTLLSASEAIQTDYEVLLIDDITSFLSPRLIERIRKDGRKVVGIYDPEAGETGRDRLLALGVDGVAPADGGPETILEVVTSVAFSGSTSRRRAPSNKPQELPSARITVVVGCDLAGDVAVVLAGAFQARQRSTVVIEVDTLTPMLAQRFSMPVVPNLLTALDAHLLLRGDIRDSFIAGPYGTTILTGIPDSADWSTVQSDEIVDLVETITTMGDEVVLKSVPYLEEMGAVRTAQGRFDICRAVVRIADDLICIAEPTPLGLSRSISWCASARTISSAPMHLVFEPRSLSNFQRGELSDEFVRNLIPDSITWLPVDNAMERAVWNGTVVPKGAFVRTVERLAVSMLEGSERSVG